MHPILLILTLVMFSCEAESDCNGTPGGTAVEDDCAQCTEGTTGLVANNLMDCAGECGGDSVLSGCDNACNSTAIEDCAGECGGEDILDECGTCDGSGIADGACDCAGNVDLGCGCGEDAAIEYWYDSDGDGLGSSFEPNLYCLVDVPENWVLNNDDLEPDCETNNTDSCFLCEGDIVYCEDLTDFTLHLNSNGDLYYKSSLPIYGFQIDILSIEIDVTLSDLAEESGLTMYMNSNEEFTRIIVFSVDASSISDNCGSILNIQGSLEDLALTNLLFSTANGEPIPIVIYDCE